MTRREYFVNSRIATFAISLAAGLLVVLSGCTESAQSPTTDDPALTAPVPTGMIRGAVLETMDSGGYTYVAIDTGQEPVWAAGPLTSVSVGDVVLVPEGMLMTQFTSKTLNRVFDRLYFVNAIMNLTTPATADAHMAGGSKPTVDDDVNVSVAELEPGKNVAWVYANRDSLAGQSVSLRGKVVKYNSNILGWNFIHIQDGSGDAAEHNHDLTVTSKGTTAVGDIVVLTGTIVLDKDFGAGYSFPILLEDASLTTE